ncbi:hypothetical protein [Paenibacillus sinopodophylli]|uniref:hypothetical protein n=1 Tax=Paenibacillus sinopodophylli TaxID=1837342 RepID=UPI00110CAD3C|nr:hypothetical protein [Paenibacillus sinopodophylli]
MRVNRGTWSYQYGYSRSAEAIASGDVGQDYVTLAEEQNHIAFALCDGISMSYFGDLAARFLGDRLRDWISTLNQGSLNARDLSNQLHGHLREWADKADSQLKDHQIPDGVKGMLRDVLLAKKKLGSATVYACGRIDMPSVAFPQGRIILAWQGDTRIRMWADQQEQKGYFGDRFHTREQWNTVNGPVGGMPHIYMNHLLHGDNEGRLLIYSDGLQIIDHSDDVSIEAISSVMKKEAVNPSSDDMSVFQIEWHSI